MILVHARKPTQMVSVAAFSEAMLYELQRHSLP